MPALDTIIIVLLLGGSVLSLTAAIGLVRLPDVFTRMHASTKAGTLGVEFIMFALMLHAWDTGVTVKAAAVILFILITAPVAAHMLGRTAYRLGEDIAPHTVCDEWQDKMRNEDFKDTECSDQKSLHAPDKLS